MPRIEEQIEIAVGATAVFRLCHDVERRAEWDERVTRAEVLTPKPIRRGSVIRFDTDPAMGAVFSWDGEVVEYHFPSGSRLKVVDVAPSGSFTSGTESWQVSGSGSSARLRVVWDYNPGGLISRALDLLVRRRTTARAIRQSLQNLKSILE